MLTDLSSTHWVIRPGAPSSNTWRSGPPRWSSWPPWCRSAGPAVSQHLKVLKDAGLVRASAEGTRRVYRVDPDGLRGLRDYLDRFWNSALTSFKRRVEQEGAQQ